MVHAKLAHYVIKCWGPNERPLYSILDDPDTEPVVVARCLICGAQISITDRSFPDKKWGDLLRLMYNTSPNAVGLSIAGTGESDTLMLILDSYPCHSTYLHSNAPYSKTLRAFKR